MDIKMGLQALIACAMMTLPAFYADIVSASAQMTVKSVISVLVVGMV
ncbi:MAG TPA: hypothetical protein VEJ68_04080 [Candidatus Bathyarchaeia archaeon]|nr:hypothetical protein [Candidatus Bathyarchaeia archaeon]